LSSSRFVRALALSSALVAAIPAAAEITNGRLEIRGVNLAVETVSVTTAVDIPTTVQTVFGGKKNDEAVTVEGLVAAGDLTGPGIDVPLLLTTAPGRRFQIPGLSREGVYTLQNIRLMNGGQIVQYAAPSVSTITVADVLQTTVRVRQLTPEEIRARGIVIDARNYDVYEYTFSFLVNGQTVEVPYPVIVDPRTHQITPVPTPISYVLPPVQTIQPPRWTPPDIVTTELNEDFESEAGPQGTEIPSGSRPEARPRIPAAIVIPNSLAVLHQFFAVILTVTNGAPEGSTARLEDVRARINVPSQLRTAGSTPPVALGQAVPIVDAAHGVTFLVAQAEGEAEWSVEALKPGTHTIEVELRATLKQDGQEDVPLLARPRATIVVHDARFNITFSHPDVVREGIDYTTLTFVTNTSAATQTIHLTNDVRRCSEVPAGANVCRVDGNDADDVTIPAGETRTIEYHLRSGVTGSVVATAGTVDSENITAAVQLHMGVSPDGIPLSPDTLLMPYYAKYVDSGLVSTYLRFLGLGYSLATAPLTQTTASFPRVIRSDVYMRAVDLARAGQAMFIADNADETRFNAIAGLTLDLLGNRVDLSEYDQLRRQEKTARAGGAAVTQQLAGLGLANGASMGSFVDHFGSAMSDRSAYVLALAHGPAVAGNEQPYALTVRGTTTGRQMSVVNEATSGWERGLPYGDLSQFSSGSEAGELALVGRWTEDVEIVVTPAVTGSFELELLFPGVEDGSTRRVHLELNGTAGVPLRVPLSKGLSSVQALLPNGGFAASNNSVAVPLAPLQLVAARQDLHLDPYGHKVSLLFNRPVEGPANVDLHSLFHGQIDFHGDGVTFQHERPISGAALQQDARILDLTFDHVLTTNASYTIAVDPLKDPHGGSVPFPQPVVPKIDNDQPAGIIYGRFVRGDNTPIAGQEVILFTGHLIPERESCVLDGEEPPYVPCNQYENPPQVATSLDDGTYLFEFVPRDDAHGVSGRFRLWGTVADGKYTYIDGAVRLPGRVQFVNLQMLGRGSAEGTVRYDNGEVVAGARVSVGSTAFDGVRSTTTDATGAFHVDDLPVGPLTFSALDADGNVAYASGEIATPGALVHKDISIYRQPFPGLGTVHGTVTRSDTGAPVAGARVGVYSQGYGMQDVFTDSDGHFTFEKVPAGFITVIAAEWSLSRVQAAFDFDLRADEVRQIDLALSVVPDQPLATVTGDILREDPLFPGNQTKYIPVPGALVKIDGMRIVTADENGHYVYDDVPATFTGRGITAYDPQTRRTKSTTLPNLTPGQATSVSLLLTDFGKGTIRVRLLNAQGALVPGYDVGYVDNGFFFPLTALGGGSYELRNAQVGHDYALAARPGPEEYGDQAAYGTGRVDFGGQTAAVTLRLPGQGIVRVKLHSDFDLIGDVTLEYGTFTGPRSITKSTSENGVAGYATFTGVPALGGYTIKSEHPLYGYAQATGHLAYNGDVGTHVLQLSRLLTIRGVVLAIDGKTPVPGATVRLDDHHQDQGAVLTNLDGTFEFRDVPPDTPEEPSWQRGFTVTAEITQNGIYRVGTKGGGRDGVNGVVTTSVILLQRGSVEGRVVYKAYKHYDPDHPPNNVPDDTPADLSDNAPVPLAKVWMRELYFPQRAFGSDQEPLTADAGGRFSINGVFVGPVRATAWSPENPDLRGQWSGSVTQEGAVTTAYIGVGDGGTGEIKVTVADPNQQNAPVLNAQVTLVTDRVFDVQSTGPDGSVTFAQVPAGTYSINAWSNALGKSGNTSTPVVVTAGSLNEVRILLEFSGKVDGHLYDPETTPPEQPVPGAQVTLDMDAGFSQRVTTDVGGSYTFEGVREGIFTLNAKDTASNRRATQSHALSAADPHPIVNLELEPTETLNLAVYVPNDTGGNSGVLAGPVNIDVIQRCLYDGCDFSHSAQGNPIAMPKLLRNEAYAIQISEIGGEQRHLEYQGRFPEGSASQPLSFVWPAYGSVDVFVTQSGSALSGARVDINDYRSHIAAATTDATGHAVIHGIPLNDGVSVTAHTLDGHFSGSSFVIVTHQSITEPVPVHVGSSATLTGLVEAETGGPSVETPVVVELFDQTHIFGITDADGRYTIAGVPTDNAHPVVVRYYGADGTTLGGLQQLLVDDSSGLKTLTLPTVRIDATPPHLMSNVPEDGAQNVSPDAPLRFVFSERIDPHVINSNNFRLQAADGSPSLESTFTTSDGPDNTFIVTLTPPPAPAGQQFRLQSNTLYRVILGQGIADLTGHTLISPIGLTFTTADYVEPRIVKTVPAVGTPIPRQITYEFRFNEPIDPAPFQAGGNGAFRLSRMSGPEADATVVEDITGNAYVDPVVGISLFFAPEKETVSDTYYRVVFSGVRDLQGNVVPEQTFRFASYDTVPPFVTLTSPVPGNAPLISGIVYDLTPDLRNVSADGTPATDIDVVDYFRVDDNGNETFLKTVSAAPFAYHFVGPDAPEAGTTLTLRAKARDLSTNESAPATIILTVKPDLPPKNVAMVLTPSSGVYAGHTVRADVTFDDEGIAVNVQLDVRGTRTDGTEYRQLLPSTIHRSTVASAWPGASFNVALPANLATGSTVTFTATVTDIRGLATSASQSTTLAVDTVAPTINVGSPAPDSRFNLGDHFAVSANIQDPETGVASVTFTVDGKTVATTGSEPSFTSASVTVTAKNEDTRVPITVTATDHNGNVQSKTFEVIYLGVADPTAPKGAWVCPIAGAALPASQQGVPLRLRLHATDDISVTAVQFLLPGQSTPVDGNPTGIPDEFGADVTIDTPAADTGSFTITAIVHDADASHTQQVPLAVTLLTADYVIDGTQAVTVDNVATFEDKTVVMRGTEARLVPHVPVRFKNLLVLDGARVDTLPTTTTSEARLDITFTDHLYVDCDSSIDVSGKGYVGGWGTNGDGSGTRNEDDHGRTVGNTVTGGPLNASGSYGGLGGLQQGSGLTNATYGSLTAPFDLGTGGGGTEYEAGAAGGGAVRITGTGTAQLAIAGSVRADGNTGIPVNWWESIATAGSGGSVFLQAPEIVIGEAAWVTANGGDDDADEQLARGGGGGRVAVVASTGLDVAEGALQARGGRNGEWNEGAIYADGGAGTVYVRRPGETLGELFVSSFDERHADSSHLTLGTPVAAGTGTLSLDAIDVGPRALLRIDSPYTAGAVHVDPTATLLDPSVVPSLTYSIEPAAGSTVAQNSQIAVTYSGAADDGVSEVRFLLSGAPDTVVRFSGYPGTVGDQPAQVPVPLDAAQGPVTLTVRITSRSGRVMESAPVTFNVLANQAPQITRFDVTPGTEMYAGHRVTVDAAATDDFVVTRLWLETNSSAEVTESNPTWNEATHTRSTRFTLDVPPATLPGTVLTLDLFASDDFPGRDATSAEKRITILHDQIAPTLSVSLPEANADVAAGNSFSVQATVVDNESGVKRVWATLEGREFDLHPLNGRPNVYVGSVSVPYVDGMRQLTVNATDYEPNSAVPVSVPLQISGGTSIEITPEMTDANFHARTLAQEGTTLVVADRSDVGSERIAIFNVADPQSPQFVRSIAAGSGGIVDVEVYRGNALVLSRSQIAVVDLATGAVRATPLETPGAAITGAGDFVLVAAGTEVRLYDLASLTLQSEADAYQATITDLVRFNDDLVVALAPDNGYADYVGHGLMTVTGMANGYVSIDMRLSMDAIEPYRGRIVGNRLYVAGRSGGAAVVSVQEQYPQFALLATIAAGTSGSGADAFGTLTAIASGSQGVALSAGAPPDAIEPLGFLTPPGPRAYDVLFNGPVLYMADERGIAVVRHLPPVVDLAKIWFSSDGIAGQATVAAHPAAIVGQAPMTALLYRNEDDTPAATVTVGADGSFDAQISAAVGDAISLVVRGSGYTVGPYPLGQVSDGRMVSIDPATTDAQFRSGIVAFDGNTLAVAGRRTTFFSQFEQHRSSKVVLFDVSDPIAPQRRQTLDVPTAEVAELLISKNRLYVGTGRIGTNGGLVVYDLDHPTTARFVEADETRQLTALARSGDYLYAGYSSMDGSVYNAKSAIKVWDISVPDTPRLIAEQEVDVERIRQLLVYGDYLIALQPNECNGCVSSVIRIFDRNASALGVVLEQVAALRTDELKIHSGRLVGTKLYVTGGENDTSITESPATIVIDLADPRQPHVLRTLDATGPVAGFDVRGHEGFFSLANGALAGGDITGTSFVPTTTRQVFGPMIGEVALGANVAYVSTGDGLAVLPMELGPAIDAEALTVSAISPGNVQVTGGAYSVIGRAPLSVTLRNGKTVEEIRDIPVSADGSFSATIPAAEAQPVLVEVTDANGISTGFLAAGAAPIGVSSTRMMLPAEVVDGGQRVRFIETAAGVAAVSGNTNSALVLYDTSNTAAPVPQAVLDWPSTPTTMFRSADTLYAPGQQNLMWLDLLELESSAAFSGANDSLTTMAVDGSLMVAAGETPEGYSRDGRIFIFDLSSGTPTYLSTAYLLTGVSFTKLVSLGQNRFAALTPDDVDGAQHDVTIVDATDPQNLTVVGQLVIPQLDAADALKFDNTLLVAGRNGGLAVVDVSNPLAPSLVRFVATPTAGRVHGMTAAGSRLAIGMGTAGIALFDIAAPATPAYLGTMPTQSQTFDVAFVDGQLYATEDNALIVYEGVSDVPPSAPPPPQIRVSRIIVEAASETSALVTGNVGAVSGVRPLTVTLRDTTSGAPGVTVNVASDGSFVATVPAEETDELSITATDGNGATAGPLDIGSMPEILPNADTSLITLTANAAGQAIVTGAADAITGLPPLTVTITNQTTNASASVVANANGSFTLAVYANPGDRIGLDVTDKKDRNTGSYDIGLMPWATSQQRVTLPNSPNGEPLGARTLVRDGNTLYVESFDYANYAAGPTLVYDVTVPKAPVLRSSFDLSIVSGLAVSGHYGYTADNYYDYGFKVVDLANPTAPPTIVHTNSQNAVSTVAIAAGRLYALLNSNSGAFEIFNLADPAHPAYVGLEYPNASSDVISLLTYKNQYLVFTSWYGAIVADLHDPDHPVVAGQSSSNGMRNGTIAGDSLIASNYYGSVERVDLTDPTQPSLSGSVYLGSGRPRGDGSLVGFTFDYGYGYGLLDISAPGDPVILANESTEQRIGDVQPVNGVVYVADELGLQILSHEGAPPVVTTSSITVTAPTATTASVAGAAGAVRGTPPLTVEVTNETTHEASSLLAAADGSFSVTIAAHGGDAVSVKAIDANGLVDGPKSIGTVPMTAPPPAIHAASITIAATSTTLAHVTATVGALTGTPPFALQLVNTTADVTIAVSPVADDGSFTADIAAHAGDALAARLSDASGGNTGLVPLGNVPAPATAASIDVSRIAVSGDGAATAIVTGSAGAVAGTGALTVHMQDTTTTATASVVASNDGSFSITISAAAGDRLELTLNGGAGQTAGPSQLGYVPFGSNVQSYPIDAAQTDASFRARTLAIAGDTLLVAGRPDGGTGSSPKLVEYDLSDPAAPLYQRTLATGTGAVTDVAIANGHALVAASAFVDVNLATGTATPIAGGDGAATAVVIAGATAFVASDSGGEGMVRRYDLSDPASPLFIDQQATAAQPGYSYRALLALGSDYLIGLTPDAVTRGHDVAIIDRHDPSALHVVADLDIPEIEAVRGTLAGSTLYVAGRNGVAVIDLSTPASPVVKTFATGGVAQAVAAAGSVAVVADGDAGLAFVDTSATPAHTLGTQAISGAAWDVALHAGQLYVASDTGLTVVEDVAVPPIIDDHAIAVGALADGHVTVTGVRGAISGHAPFDAKLTVGNQPDVTVQIAADGSFNASVPGATGEVVVLTAVDSAGRTAVRSVGAVPVEAALHRKVTAMERGDVIFADCDEQRPFLPDFRVEPWQGFTAAELALVPRIAMRGQSLLIINRP
jgi:hypothetical protein